MVDAEPEGEIPLERESAPWWYRAGVLAFLLTPPLWFLSTLTGPLQGEIKPGPGEYQDPAVWLILNHPLEAGKLVLTVLFVMAVVIAIHSRFSKRPVPPGE